MCFFTGWAANHVSLGHIDEAHKLYEQALNVASVAATASKEASAQVEVIDTLLNRLELHERTVRAARAV